MQIIPKQNPKCSRPCRKSDLAKVKKDAKGMIAICKKPLGRYPGAIAISHCQVESVDPLRFFVLKDGRIILNPKIINYSGEEASDVEGCYSYAFRTVVKVKRHKELLVNFQTLEKNGEIKENKNEKVNGIMAQVFQHEVDHFNGRSIYS